MGRSKALKGWEIFREEDIVDSNGDYLYYDDMTPYYYNEEVEVKEAEKDPASPGDGRDASKSYKFSNGMEVETPFVLNSGQIEALNKLDQFASAPSSFGNKFVLKGYAGTGKTSIMKVFDTFANKKFSNVIYSAPTNKANIATMQNNPNATVITLHKLFGLRPDLNIQDGVIDMDKQITIKAADGQELGPKDLIIIDESSMIGDDLYKYIDKAIKQRGVSVIFIGDPAQLGPVNDGEGMSPIFRDKSM